MQKTNTTNTNTENVVTSMAAALSTFSQSSVALSLEGMNRERTGAERLSHLQERKSGFQRNSSSEMLEHEKVDNQSLSI